MFFTGHAGARGLQLVGAAWARETGGNNCRSRQNVPKLIVNSYLQESKNSVCMCDRFEDLNILFSLATKFSTILLVVKKSRTLELLAFDE